MLKAACSKKANCLERLEFMTDISKSQDWLGHRGSNPPRSSLAKYSQVIADAIQRGKEEARIAQTAAASVINSAPNQFAYFAQRHGIELDATDIEPTNGGEAIEVTDPNSKSGSKHFWYYFDLYDGYACGTVGNYKTGEKYVWSSHTDEEFKAEISEEIKAQIEANRVKREAIEKRKAEEQQKKIDAALERSAPATTHPYMERKQVKVPKGVLADRDQLVIPLRDMDGEIKSIQLLANDKRYQDGTLDRIMIGKFQGCFFPIGDIKQGATVYICEGLATGASIAEATRKTVVCAMTAGNITNVLWQFKVNRPDVKFILCCDNDLSRAGHDVAEKAKEVGNVKAAFMPDFSVSPEQAAEHQRLVEQGKAKEKDAPQFGDFNDLHCREGIERVRSFLGIKENPIKLYTLAEMKPNPSNLRQVIKDWLTLKSAAMLYGFSGVGKSFITLDMAIHVASGKDWCGHKVTQGGVLYVCAEGWDDFTVRATGAKQALGLPEDFDQFLGFDGRIDLMDATDADNLMRACEDLKQGSFSESFSLIVLDTMTRCFTGDENNRGDIQQYFNYVDDLAKMTGACVLTVHHTGKEGGTARGSSAIRGSLDTELSVRWDLPLGANMDDMTMEDIKKLPVKLSSLKQKGFTDPAPKLFTFTVHDTGISKQDGSDETLTTLIPNCLGEQANKLIAKAQAKATGKNQTLLRDLAVQQTNAAKKLNPSLAIVWLNIEDLLAHLTDSVSDTKDRAYRRANLKRAYQDLLEKGILKADENDADKFYCAQLAEEKPW